MTKNILVIEDNQDIARLISLHLGDSGYDVVLAMDGVSGLRIANSNVVDLIILDLMLPALDGLEICRRLRACENHTAIIMLTAKASEVDRVVGLEIGADDYITKPFSMHELLARVKATFRRVDQLTARQKPSVQKLCHDNITIDLEKHQVCVDGKMTDLTAKEYSLLVQFAAHPGRVYTRQQLLDDIWGHGHAGFEHTVNSHINRLRRKIERDPARPEFVLTVWGIGYKFNDALARV